MTSPQRTLLFVDTNVLLHFKPLREIDWGALLTVEGITVAHVEIVVARAVVAEIDKQKWANPNRKIRDRAGRISRELEQAWEEHYRGQPQLLRGAYGLVVQLRDSDAAFETHDLRREVADDALIAAMLGHQADGTTLVLVSGDTGPRMTARSHGLRVIAPPSVDRLPGEEDVIAKELKKLRQENAVLRSKEPVLSLEFATTPGDSSATLLVARLKPVTSAPTDAWEAAMRKAEALVPVRSPAEPGGPSEPVAAPRSADMRRRSLVGRTIDLSQLVVQPAQIPTEEFERYARERAAFLDAYAETLRAAYQHWALLRRSFPVRLALHNRGTAPASNVTVHFRIPDGPEAEVDGFFAEHTDGVPEEPFVPDPPSPPSRPQSSLELMMKETSVFLPPLENPLLRFQPPATPPRGLDLRRTNSFEGVQEFERLRHHDVAALEGLRLWFPLTTTPRGFEIGYRIAADNVAAPVEGTLRVKVVRAE